MVLLHLLPDTVSPSSSILELVSLPYFTMIETTYVPPDTATLDQSSLIMLRDSKGFMWDRYDRETGSADGKWLRTDTRNSNDNAQW